VDLRRIHDISLKWKLLIPFLVLSFIGTTSLILLNLHSQTRLIEAQEQKILSDYYQAFLDQIEDRERSALSLAYQVAMSPEVQMAFARRDRQALVDLLLPTYQILEREFGVKQFHFHTRPAVSFLRLHRLYEFGDEMESFRHTILRVAKTGKGVAGLEWGVAGFGVRGVVPVYYHNIFIGTCEIGYSVERSFLESLKRRYQMNLAIFVPRGTAKGFSQSASSSGQVVEVGAGVYNKVFESQRIEVLMGPASAPGEAVLLGPLLDYSGKSNGVVQISVDRVTTLARLKKSRNIMLAIMVAALIISSTLIWWVAALFLRPIQEIVHAAREIAKGKRLKQIKVSVRDEIGTLADSLNDMLDSLSQARQEIQQYCETLEERVEERTHELVEEKEKYETLVQNAPLIVYRIVPDNINVFVNRFVEELLGYTAAEVIDNPDFWTSTAHPEDREKVRAHLEACLSEGRDFLVEYRGIHKDGSEVYLLNHAMPLMDRRGRVEAVDGIIVDVSERRRLQEKIIQTEELRTMSSISARLAHEIRNPLTSAGGFARRLYQQMDEGDQHREKVEIILKEVGRLEQILRMILSYLKPVRLDFSEVDLNELVNEAVIGARTKLHSREVNLKLDLNEPLPKISADRSHLCHALETILQNACEHMPRGEEIQVSTSYNGGVTVQLCYSALHLADDDVDHFFTPFAAGELREDHLDVGLTKVVIHKHGGTVSVNRNEENRIVITITFVMSGHS
jgi:PAS domain S-box-containing protein